MISTTPIVYSFALASVPQTRSSHHQGYWTHALPLSRPKRGRWSW